MKNSKKILHLEDDQEWLQIVRDALGEFNVYGAQTLKDAFDLYQDMDFDVAILDISLIPDDSQDEQGEFLLKALEGLSILPGKRIIILSAYLTGSYQDRMRKYFKHYRVMDAIPKQDFDSKAFRKLVEEAANSAE
jgi:DNA-binding response OmpR family regulator